MGKPVETLIKGQGFKGFMGAVKTLFGDEAHAKLGDALPEELRSTWVHGGIVASGWYPIGWYREFHAAAQATIKNQPQLAWRIGYEATRSDLQGVYRFVLGFLSPHTIMAQAPRIFALYARGGRVDVRENEAGKVVLAYEECHGYNRHIWQDLIGGTVATIETTKVKISSHSVLEGGGDDSRVVLCLRWDAQGSAAREKR